ncbi:zinc-dependent metalloprotease [Streptomyces sp. NPDC002845]
MTPQFTILDDTRRHPELAARLFDILHAAAPMAEEITGLSLPPRVRFRLLAPKKWRRAQMRARQRILTRDIADLELTPDQFDPVRVALKATGVSDRLILPLMLATSMEADDGQYETIMNLLALRHAGILTHEPSLHQVSAHELIHHAQFAATGGTVWRTLFPQLRGIDSGSVTTWREGHADWADRQITTRLFGAPVQHRTDAPKSWRYLLHNRLPGIRRLGPSPETYEQGSRFFSHVIAESGIDLTNRAWKDTELLPTTDEFANPDAWICRVTGVNSAGTAS